MTSQPALRRLIDLPGIAELERKALMKPAYQDLDARANFPEIDACSTELFGITADQAEEHPRPEGWDNIENKAVPAQVAAFEAEGWDVTDDKRKPLRMFSHFNQQLWLAIRGVAGEVPFVPEDDKPERWATSLAAEAARFRKR